MIIMFLILVIPWVIWIALAFRVQKQNKRIKELELKSVPKIDYETLQELYRELFDRYHNEIATGERVPAKNEKFIIVDPEQMTYSQLENCTNYFIENQLELKSQPK